jgi:hypothetical protein
VAQASATGCGARLDLIVSDPGFSRWFAHAYAGADDRNHRPRNFPGRRRRPGRCHEVAILLADPADSAGLNDESARWFPSETAAGSHLPDAAVNGSGFGFHPPVKSAQAGDSPRGPAKPVAQPGG